MKTLVEITIILLAIANLADAQTFCSINANSLPQRNVVANVPLDSNNVWIFNTRSTSSIRLQCRCGFRLFSGINPIQGGEIAITCPDVGGLINLDAQVPFNDLKCEVDLTNFGEDCEDTQHLAGPIPYVWSERTASNEAPPFSCGSESAIEPSNAIVTGMRCTGNDCSHIDLQCGDDRGTPGYNLDFGRYRRVEESYWTPFFSEEQGDVVCKDDFFMTGITCDDNRCDNISLECTRVTGRYRGSCRWSRTTAIGPGAIVEQGTYEVNEFGNNRAITGVRCLGDFCRTKFFHICEYGYEDISPLMLYEDRAPLTTANRFTKVTTDGKEPATCGEVGILSRVLVNSFNCIGGRCDNVQLGCTHHSRSLEDDRLVEAEWTQFFSEESRDNGNPNGPRNGRFYCPSNHFMTGIACDGAFCDNLSMQCTKVEGRTVVPNSCEWTRTFLSEEQGGLFIGTATGYTNQYIRGIDCDGSFCDNKRFYVCSPQYDSEEDF